MKTECKHKMDLWLSAHPESSHPVDEMNKFDFVISLCLNNDRASFDDLYGSFTKSHPDYDDLYVRELCDAWETEIEQLRDFGVYFVDRINSRKK